MRLTTWQALAFSMTGVPVMSIIFPLIYELLYETFGMYGAVLIVGKFFTFLQVFFKKKSTKRCDSIKCLRRCCLFPPYQSQKWPYRYCPALPHQKTFQRLRKTYPKSQFSDVLDFDRADNFWQIHGQPIRQTLRCQKRRIGKIPTRYAKGWIFFLKILTLELLALI